MKPKKYEKAVKKAVSEQTRATVDTGAKWVREIVNHAHRMNLTPEDAAVLVVNNIPEYA